MNDSSALTFSTLGQTLPWDYSALERSAYEKSIGLFAHLFQPFTSPLDKPKGRVTSGKFYAFHSASTRLGTTLTLIVGGYRIAHPPCGGLHR